MHIQELKSPISSLNLTAENTHAIVRYTRYGLSDKLTISLTAGAQLLFIDLVDTLPKESSTISVELGENASCVFLVVMKLENARFTYNIKITSQRRSQSTVTVLQHLISAQCQIDFNHYNAAQSAINFMHYALLDKNAHALLNGRLVLGHHATQAESRQHSSIIMLDDKSQGTTQPFLEVEHHDVIAQHGSALGCISFDELWYSATRGLSENVLKDLIREHFLHDHIEKQKLPKNLEALIYEYI